MVPTAVKAIIKKDGQIVFVRQRGENFFQLPGGKPHGQETHYDTLKRELKEEIGVSLKRIKYFDTITARHPSKNKVYKLFLYEAAIKGEPRPCGENEEIRYVDRKLAERKSFLIS